MPTFSRSLEQSLHRALALANERHHEYATLEHLLLALLDDQDAAAVMRACNVDLEKLRRSLVGYLETELENLVTEGNEDSKPTAGFQRVIQRAVIHVQSSGREEVTGANVLVAIFAERESHAAYFLQEQDMTRYDAVNYISHGIAKRPNLYRVLILNDDYTPMEFVVHVLERFFNKDHETATRIMLHVHHHGIGECGVYTYEVAETKVTQVMDFARKHQHPLQCVMEKK